MLTPEQRAIKLRRLDEVLAELETPPYPPERRLRQLLYELDRLEFELGKDDLKRMRGGNSD